MRRRLVAAAGVALFLFGVVATRAVWQGRSALSRGDAAIAAGDTAEAIRWWRRAARWYLPLAPHVGDAYDRLEELATQAASAGDRATALAAWQGVRSSILATRSFYTPQSDRLEPANRAIAALMAAAEPDLAAPTSSPAEREAWHYQMLARDEAPSVGWSVLALLGFAAWIGGAALFAWRAVDKDDRLVQRPALVSALVVAGGLIIWMVGLYNA
jgi:hypothetical protein